ncbi:MAG: T9SS type A sorting domain-containing protein [Bacteroidota bacterium]
MTLEFSVAGTIIADFHPPATPEVETGVINLSIYDNGFFGATETYEQLFGEKPLTYNGFTPLRVGTVLVGVDGEVATNPYDGASEFVRTSSVVVGLVGEDRPAAQAAFRSEELGLSVTNLLYGVIDQAHLIMRLSVSSTTGAEIKDAYIGLFTDWNIVDAPDDSGADDRGGFDADFQIPYVYDADEGQFYGVYPIFDPDLTGTLSGYSTDVDVADDAQLFNALTTSLPPADGEAERGVVIGQGPFTLPADGTPVIAFFALVPGLTKAEMIDNALAAYFTLYPPLSDEADEVASHRLAAVYPNPVSTTATVGFTLATTEQARVEVFDLLGRRVATLTDGFRAAGRHTVTLDATGLPSGVYVVRLVTPSTTLSERVTVVR